MGVRLPGGDPCPQPALDPAGAGARRYRRPAGRKLTRLAGRGARRARRVRSDMGRFYCTARLNPNDTATNTTRGDQVGGSVCSCRSCRSGVTRVVLVLMGIGICTLGVLVLLKVMSATAQCRQGPSVSPRLAGTALTGESARIGEARTRPGLCLRRRCRRGSVLPSACRRAKDGCCHRSR